MIKKVCAALVIAMLLVGCTAVQDKLDSYKEKRAKVVNTAKFVKAEKDCIVKCNGEFTLGLKRAECKAGCIK